MLIRYTDRLKIVITSNDRCVKEVNINEVARKYIKLMLYQYCDIILDD